MKDKNKKRRPKPLCLRCRGGYTQAPAPGDDRPQFTCTKCGYVWTCGLDGGEYRLMTKGDV
jgi:hypothetical protein